MRPSLLHARILTTSSTCTSTFTTKSIPTLDTQYLVRVLLHRFCDVVCLEARNGAPMTQYCAAIGGGLAQILQKLKDLSFGHARNAGRARGSPSQAKI